MLTVYFCNSIIQMVEGAGGKRPAVQRVLMMEAPEGSLINGVVTDEEPLRQALEKFWADNALPKKDVRLVLNSTQLVHRSVEAPLLKKVPMLEYLAREFADEGKGEYPVYGYFAMATDKKAKRIRLFATMAARDYLAGVTELFKAIGVKLAGICTAQGAAVTLLARLGQTRDKTAIVQIADGSSLMSILLVKGSYFYSTTNRLFSESGSAAYGVEIARQASNLLQFVKSQQVDSAVEQIFLAGLGDGDVKTATDAIGRAAPGLAVDVLRPGETIALDEANKGAFSRIIYPVGALCCATETDLLHNATDDPRKRAAQKENLRRMVPTFIVGGVLLAAVLALLGWYLVLDHRYNELEDYLTDPLVVQSSLEYDRLSAENDRLRTGVNEINMDWASIYSYPRGTQKLVSDMASLASGYVEISTMTSFAAANGTLNLTTQAAEVEKINQYISRLMQQDMFESVSYSGYTYNERDNLWSVNVSLVLSERAGKTQDWMDSHAIDLTALTPTADTPATDAAPTSDEEAYLAEQG